MNNIINHKKQLTRSPDPGFVLDLVQDIRAVNDQAAGSAVHGEVHTLFQSQLLLVLEWPDQIRDKFHDLTQ